MKVARKKTLWLHVFAAVVTGLFLIASLYLNTLNTLIYKFLILVMFVAVESFLHFKYNDYILAVLSEYVLVSVLVFIALSNSQLGR